MRSVTCGSGVALVLLLVAGPAKADVKDEIIKLSNAYDGAVKSGDRKTLERIYDDKGEFILPDGRKLDKRTYIAEILEVTYETAKSDIDSIRIFGDVAVETGTWNARGKSKFEQIVERTRYIAVWTKSGGSWVLTAEQSTTIANGPRRR